MRRKETKDSILRENIEYTNGTLGRKNRDRL